MRKTVSKSQWKVFKALLDSNQELSIPQIETRSGLEHPQVAATLTYAQEQGWLTIKEHLRKELILSDSAESQMKKGFPERQVLPILAKKGRMPMQEMARIAKQKEIPMGDIIKWSSLRGWVKKNKGELIITEDGHKAIDNPDADEKAINLAIKSGPLFLDQLEKQGINPARVNKLLNKRTSLAKIKERTIRLAFLTDAGRKILSENIKIIKEQNILSPEDIESGEWKNIKLRHYDVTLEAEKIYPAKIHPMQKIIQQTRKAFLEMGFTEIVSPQAESAFWDFDALFQPQDHPARDMQDTFYLTHPSEAKLPPDKFVENVKQTHENGWKTGSTGWGYKWDLSRAKEMVLRTHTTATTIRALAEDPNPPRKVFCVGKVYRNEAISYKHLPEFFQVDGIIIDEDASFATLLGTLQEFYRKMGFKKVKFKPAFFPYTEPSAEAFVFMESKKSWIELGGSGVFRPEVTRPFGCKVPVLAWGLGLDRLAMLRYGINDIRELYWSDLDKIKEVPLCR